MNIFGRSFGVELEVLAPAMMGREGAAAIIAQAGIACRAEGYGHGQVTQWKVVSDGSITGGNGMEIVSPPLTGEAGLAQVRTVCGVLTAAGFKINKSCGLHVHVAARGLDLDAMKRLARLYGESEQVIDSLLPASRRGNANYFCRSVASADHQAINSAADVRALARAIGMDRYMPGEASRYVKLNLCSYWRHGTVEFRQHSGTVDADKACNWVRFCLRMVEASLVAGPAGPVASRARAVRPGTKLAAIVALLTRPEGCTQAEVLRATGWPSVSMPQQARAAGLQLERRRLFGRSVYRAAAPVATEQATVTVPVNTLEGLAARLGMAGAELAYWAARRSALAGPQALAA